MEKIETNTDAILHAIRECYIDTPINDNKCLIASWVYLDISQSKPFNDVQFNYSKNFKLIYIIAKHIPSDKQHVIVPVSKYENVDLSAMSDMENEFGQIFIGCELHLAIVDTNSVILYYRCSNTLRELDSLELESENSRKVL